MPMLRDMGLLQGPFKVKAEKVLKRLEEAWKPLGRVPVVLETRRELAVQMAYYARARCPVEVVKEYFKAAGLWAITDGEAKMRTTGTMQSKHLVGKAIDVAPSVVGKQGVPDWKAPDAVWLAMGEAAKAEGLEWGGSWKSVDKPHIEEV